MDPGAFILEESRFAAHNYNPLPVVLSRGEGIKVWDITGRVYLDFLSAYSAQSFGHCHPRILKALVRQATTLTLTSRAFHHDKMLPLLKKLTQLTGLPKTLMSNGGVEAVETAIKAARRFGYRWKKVPEDKAEIIVMEHNFHGRTTTVISFSTEPDYRKDFGPFTPGFKVVPFGDLEALKKAITPYTVAVLTEPALGEAGIYFPPEGWLKGVRALCDEHHVLLLLDEIQTGFGRTGKCFAYQHEDILPDGLILGKALGGGMLPVSCFMATEALMSVFEPASHGSTFGGNPLACAVALEALLVLEEEKLVEKSKTLGEYFLRKLRAIDSPLIKEVRGKGLFVGLEIDSEKMSARELSLQLMAQGILTKDVHEKVIRLAPPLVIEQSELDGVVSVIEGCLSVP